MSIQAMAWVFEHSKSELSDRLVLIAIANHCDAHWSCYPSVDMIAVQAKVSRSTVVRAIKELVRLGELEVSPGGRGKGQRSSYRVAHYQGCHDDTLKLDSRVSSTPSKGVTGDSHKPLGNQLHASARACTPASDQGWVPEGALEALSDERRNDGLAKVRAIRAGGIIDDRP